ESDRKREVTPSGRDARVRPHRPRALRAVQVVRAIGVLEPGGAQLSALRLSRALRPHGIETRLVAGDASPAGLDLARAHGFEVEHFAEVRGLQWEPCSEFAAWLQERCADADLVHGHMFGAWWAAALGLEDVVRFSGWQAQPERFVAGAAVHVVPSRQDAWSQSAVLAMGLGVPVVATAVEGLPDTLDAGRGVLVAPDEPRALAAA